MARQQYPTAAAFVPESTSLTELAGAAQRCQGCDLYANATQTVFGQGAAGAPVLLVGEQPGDVEDRRGEPFVGPAGKLLDRALADAELDRTAAYVTNAVKHFRWKATAGGTRRLHAKPDAAQVSACRPWLTAELDAVDPEFIVALGATAALSLLGPQFRVTQHRGMLLPWPPDAGPYADLCTDAAPAKDVSDASGRRLLATIHPSAVLRSTGADRDAMYDGLVSDLRVVADALGR
jgi:uracil-DNA glycosylase